MLPLEEELEVSAAAVRSAPTTREPPFVRIVLPSRMNWRPKEAIVSLAALARATKSFPF